MKNKDIRFTTFRALHSGRWCHALRLYKDDEVSESLSVSSRRLSERSKSSCAECGGCLALLTPVRESPKGEELLRSLWESRLRLRWRSLFARLGGEVGSAKVRGSYIRVVSEFQAE